MAASENFVEAPIPSAEKDVVEIQSYAAPSTSWVAGLSASVSLLVGAAVYKLKSQKSVPSISPLDVYTKGLIPAATLAAAQPAFAMETNKLAPIATALFIALPTFFLIILYVSTRANLDNQSGAFDQDYYDKSKSVGKKKANLAAKLRGAGVAFYAQKRGGK
jgi:photosystem II reaction center protein PsbM